MSGWPGDFVTPARARLVRVDVDLERMDAVRAGELQLTSGGCLPIGPLAPYPGVRTRPASRRDVARDASPQGGLW